MYYLFVNDYQNRSYIHRFFVDAGFSCTHLTPFQPHTDADKLKLTPNVAAAAESYWFTLITPDRSIIAVPQSPQHNETQALGHLIRFTLTKDDQCHHHGNRDFRRLLITFRRALTEEPWKVIIVFISVDGDCRYEEIWQVCFSRGGSQAAS